MSTAVSLDTQETEWPVSIFRKTTIGWERMMPKNKIGQIAIVKASPRKDCIVVRRLRLRVSVASANDKDERKSRSVVVRRRSSILVSSNKSVRALVFKFATEKDCMEFSDRFIAHNPHALLKTDTLDDDWVHVQDKESQARDVLSYIARLLHDPDFANYIESLEKCLSSSEDGTRMLEGLVKTKQGES